MSKVAVSKEHTAFLGKINIDKKSVLETHGKYQVTYEENLHTLFYEAIFLLISCVKNIDLVFRTSNHERAENKWVNKALATAGITV